jgi:hypothetical protein
MRRESLGLPMALVLAAAAVSPALADVPPPEGYVEKCTIAKQQTSKTECLECMGMHDQTERCTNLLLPYCYTKVCQTWGSTSFISESKQWPIPNVLGVARK